MDDGPRDLNAGGGMDHPPGRRRLAWSPIPLLLGLMVVLWVADLRVVWSMPVLSWLVHYGSAVAGVVFIVVAAGRSFLANGQPSVLMLGCGVLMSQIGAGLSYAAWSSVRPWHFFS